MFFDINDVLSKNCYMNFITGERGVGKTFGSLKYCVENYLNTGRTFVYMRRLDEEIEECKDTLMTQLQVKGLFEDYSFGIKKNTILCNGKTMGYFFAINGAVKKKSVAFPTVSTIIFDEFIREDKKYLKEEFQKFLGSVFTIQRERTDLIILMLANQSTIYNPYYIELDIKPDPNSKSGFTVFKNKSVLIYNSDNQEFQNHMTNTPMGKLIKDTKYGQFMINNKNIHDDYSYVDRLQGVKKEPIVNLIISGCNVVVYECFIKGIDLLYFEQRERVINVDSLNYDKMLVEDSSLTKARNNYLSKKIGKYISRGEVRFKDVPTKNLIESFIF